MKLRIPFDILINNLDYVSTVVEDKLLDDSMRNIIFKLSERGVSLIGYNSIAICKTHLQEGDYRVEFGEGDLKTSEEGEVMYIQVKSKELNNFLSTFKSLNKTKPSDVLFETINAKIRLTVFEEPVDASDTHLSQPSVWVYDNINVKENVLKEINQKIEEGGQSLQSLDILLYLTTLLPLLSDEGGNSLPSKMHFSKDYVYVMPKMFATLFTNVLPEAFQDVVLSYSALNFLKKVLDHNDVVSVNKTATHVTLVTDTSEALLRYTTKMPDQKVYQNAVKKDNGVGIDKLYLKDVLKRLSISNESITITIKANEEKMEVKNSKFNQVIPLTQVKGMEGLGSVVFKLTPEILNKAVIGDNTGAFPDELFLYVVPQQTSGYTLVFADSTSSWFSIISVR